MTVYVLSPFTAGRAIELGNRLWRKKVLPVGTINYKGRTLQFTRAYLAELAEAFAGRAYDQVPFQLADANNTHTNDPERTRGEIVDLELADDGLYALARMSDRGEQILSENPDLGVSARIVEDYERSDGQFFPKAIQHVLGTLDPRIPRLGPWQAIEAANDGTVCIDLSASTWEGIEPEPDAREVEAADEALAEADAELEAALAAGREAAAADLYDGLTLDEIIADAELEMETQRAALAAPGTQGRIREIAANLAAHGYGDQAAGLYAELSGVPAAGAIELANPEGLSALNRALDGQLAAGAQRRAQDSGALARRTEDRLAQLLGRHARGTYDTAAVRLANPSAAARELARARWGRNEPGLVTGDANCGPSDDLGYCQERFHAAGCGSAATPGITEALQPELREVADRPYADAAGRTWDDQFGEPMTLSQHIEALSGQRRRDSLFEPGPGGGRELPAPRRPVVFGDADDPEQPRLPVPPATKGSARRLAAQTGLAVPSAAEVRDRARDRAADAALRRQGLARPDERWDISTRREQSRRPVELAAEEPDGGLLPGELPRYTWARP